MHQRRIAFGNRSSRRHTRMEQETPPPPLICVSLFLFTSFFLSLCHVVLLAPNNLTASRKGVPSLAWPVCVVTMNRPCPTMHPSLQDPIIVRDRCLRGHTKYAANVSLIRIFFCRADADLYRKVGHMILLIRFIILLVQRATYVYIIHIRIDSRLRSRESRSFALGIYDQK